uniref:Integrase, catalytic region, zinc finger, CCHC-type, peptidase aspartic, catalytic n=1 Tax=Tanacetum cinerariifolium TaxID=118510 RepID=A0A6L2K7Q0_TANCI|nr:integrase, catalytic region, zinc finger, CCHC-type, peptidase aspartic, catalytic [Tanacetum cinerariifolium]
MSNTSEDIQAVDSDTHPPMLDMTDYESSVPHLKVHFNADVRETNIVLQGSPKDIYKLINHNIEAKAIWDNVKMLLEGSELTKEDRESQLYDEFERFKMLPVLDEEDLLFLAGDHANTFDAGVDEQPTIFMANRSSAGPSHLQAGSSHASTLSEVQNLDNDVDHVDVNHKEHEIHNKVQQLIVVDSYTVKTGNFNIIPYEQYLKNNEAFVVLNDVSSVLNDDSLATELAIYKEQVEKEDKLLAELVNMRNLKEKFKDKLYKQEQSMQTVHMLCKPKSLYDHENEMALGYQNPYYLSKAKRAQPTLYDGHEILKTNHVPAIVPTSKEDLELPNISREKMIEKFKDPECVK